MGPETLSNKSRQACLPSGLFELKVQPGLFWAWLNPSYSLRTWKAYCSGVAIKGHRGVKDPLFSVGSSHLPQGLNVIKIVFFFKSFLSPKSKKKKNVKEWKWLSCKQISHYFESNFSAWALLMTGHSPVSPFPSRTLESIHHSFIWSLEQNTEGNQVKHQARQSQSFANIWRRSKKLKKVLETQAELGTQKRGKKCNPSSHLTWDNSD